MHRSLALLQPLHLFLFLGESQSDTATLNYPPRGSPARGRQQDRPRLRVQTLASGSDNFLDRCPKFYLPDVPEEKHRRRVERRKLRLYPGGYQILEGEHGAVTVTCHLIEDSGQLGPVLGLHGVRDPDQRHPGSPRNLIGGPLTGERGFQRSAEDVHRFCETHDRLEAYPPVTYAGAALLGRSGAPTEALEIGPSERTPVVRDQEKVALPTDGEPRRPRVVGVLEEFDEGSGVVTFRYVLLQTCQVG